MSSRARIPLMARRWLKYVGLAAVIVAIAALLASVRSSAEAPAREQRTESPARRAAQREAATATARAQAPPLERGPAEAAAPAVRAREARDDEPALMARLRELKDSNPELSLELARQGNARFVHSEDAPERAWFIVRSLVNLRRFEEARAEARVMVDTYRDTPWALDVERHLLVHPGSTSEPPAAD